MGAWRAAAAATIAAFACAAPAAAAVVDDNPAASSRGPGQVSVFVRGADATLQVSELSGGAFTPWRSLGGVLTSGPGAEGRAGTVTDVFIRSGDDALYQRYFLTSSGWSGWYGLGGRLLSAPAVSARQGTGQVDIFWRGADNGIEQKYWTPGSGWSAVLDDHMDPGLTLSAPASVSRGSGLVDVFVRGTNDLVHVDSWNGSSWSGWSQVPGGMRTSSAPAVTTRVTGTMDLFVRSPSGAVAWASYDGAGWTAWRTVPGEVDSAPAAVSDHPNRIYLFARRGGDVVWNLYDRGLGPEAGWRGWQPLHPAPPPPPPPPPVTCDPAAGRMTAGSRLARYGRRPTVRGRVVHPDGSAMAGATVTVRPAAGGWLRRAVTGRAGRYAVRVPAGPTRALRVEVWAPGAPRLVCAGFRARTRAGVTLRVPRRVRPGGTVRFRGRLKGRPVPRRGKLVELQAFDGGRWRTFAQPRSRRDGRYHSAYELRRTFGPRTFRFRARVRREANYPYELGYSRVARVRVR